MKSQAVTAMTPDLCAREVMETIPLVMHFIRAEMRSRRAPSLSVPQFRVLTFLSRRPGAPLSGVAEHLGVARSTASATVDRLVRRKLVQRTTPPEERRSVALKLTPAGKQHLQQAREATVARMAKVLADLPAADLHQVNSGLVLLSGAFRQVIVSRQR